MKKPDQLTLEELELLHDKVEVWGRAAKEGNMEMRDYNRRCAEALARALAIIEGPTT
jgi:hypothetical protein